MAKIIEPAHTERTERRVRMFDLQNDRNCGFHFDVIDGKLVFPCEAAKANFQYCLDHPEEYKDMGIVTLKTTYWQEARAICECGKEILLRDSYMGAGQCEHCGRWHNLFGQELLPPEHWDSEYED